MRSFAAALLALCLVPACTDDFDKYGRALGGDAAAPQGEGQADGPAPPPDARAAPDGEPAPPDAATDAPARPDAAPDAPRHVPYSSPDDFDRTGCATEGFDRIALPGIWHAERLDLIEIFYPPSLRFATEGGVLSGSVFGEPAEVRQEPGTLFVYLGRNDQFPVTISFLACTLPDASGAFEALAARCSFRAGANCETGRVRMWPVERNEPQTAGGVQLLGHLGLDVAERGDFFANVVVDGTFAYVVGFGSLRVIDVADAAAMRQVGYAEPESPEESYNDVKVTSVATAMGMRKLAVIASNIQLTIYDVTDPATPTVVGHALEGQGSHTLAIDGGHIYATNGNHAGLSILSLANPMAPAVVADFTLPEGLSTWGQAFLHDLWVADGRAYLCWWGAGMLIVDVTTPSRPRMLGRFDYEHPTSHSVAVTTVGGRLIAVHGDESLDGKIRIVDVTDPAAPRQLGREIQQRRQVSTHNVFARGGDKAWVAWYQDGLRQIDLSNPEEAFVDAFYNTWDPATAHGAMFYEGALGVFKTAPPDDKIYVVDSKEGLFVLR